jgi:hypothetical protein
VSDAIDALKRFAWLIPRFEGKLKMPEATTDMIAAMIETPISCCYEHSICARCGFSQFEAEKNKTITYSKLRFSWEEKGARPIT